MLLVIDHHIEGPVRECMLVAYYRHAAQRTDSNSKLDEVCQLLRSTGYLKCQPGKKVPNYPEEYFRRIEIDRTFLEAVVERLRSHDIYHLSQSHPEDRSTALAQQAAMLVICLYFIPDILHNQTAKMREIVDKFFPDNWVSINIDTLGCYVECFVFHFIPHIAEQVTSIYMGLIVNLIEVWEPYRAARLALSNTLLTNNVRECSVKHGTQMQKLISQLSQLLKEGVLNEEFLLDNMQKIMNVIRRCNVNLRWIVLHTNALTPGTSGFPLA